MSDKQEDKQEYTVTIRIMKSCEVEIAASSVNEALACAHHMYVSGDSCTELSDAEFKTIRIKSNT